MLPRLFNWLRHFRRPNTRRGRSTVARRPRSIRPAFELLEQRELLAVFYANNFDGAVGPEWSATAVDQTPTNGRRFLGQFSNETVRLSLANVAAGDLRLAFDLYALQSWDGSDPTFGPDV